MGNSQWLGDISHLDDYPSVIAVSEADELRRHFRIGGLSAFARSTSAGMLDRAELFSVGTRPCLRCGGHINKGTWKEKDADGNDVEVTDPIPERGGCGFIPSKSPRCLEVSKRQAELLAILGIDAESVPLAADVPCPECECRGWIVAPRSHATGNITARPMGSSVKGEPSAAMMDLDLQTLAICTRRLEMADVLLPLASAAITAAYEPGGSVGALWHLTPAGVKLLRKNHRGLPPQAFFESERVAQEQNRDLNKAALFKAADDQSRYLIEAACRAWNAVVAHEERLAHG